MVDAAAAAATSSRQRIVELYVCVVLLMGFEIRHSQVLCAPQYASALANAMRQFGLDGLLVSYSTLACDFAPPSCDSA